jgi:hypothetical protein
MTITVTIKNVEQCELSSLMLSVRINALDRQFITLDKLDFFGLNFALSQRVTSSAELFQKSVFFPPFLAHRAVYFDLTDPAKVTYGHCCKIYVEPCDKRKW